MKTLELIIPAWAVVALVNSDESGLSESDSHCLTGFETHFNKQGYITVPIDSVDIGFTHNNDLDKLAGDCYRCTFQAIEQKL